MFGMVFLYFWHRGIACACPQKSLEIKKQIYERFKHPDSNAERPLGVLHFAYHSKRRGLCL
jgi:hypothetical protein